MKWSKLFVSETASSKISATIYFFLLNWTNMIFSIIPAVEVLNLLLFSSLLLLAFSFYIQTILMWETLYFYQISHTDKYQYFSFPNNLNFVPTINIFAGKNISKMIQQKEVLTLFWNKNKSQCYDKKRKMIIPAHPSRRMRSKQRLCGCTDK